MARPLVINSDLLIPSSEFSLSFARSTGPGGQNVNKVNSKAVLRWKISDNASVPGDALRRFRERYGQRINNVGEVVIASDRHRDQPRNITDCYEKLRELIVSVLVAPRARKRSRPTRAAIERRLQSKRRKSDRKRNRQYRPGRDD